MTDVVVGTAGWSIPAAEAARFASEGTALQRYAGTFAGVEINSSFHRSHRRSTWERWAASVPDGFRFAAKVPKTITHGRKLVDCGALVAQFAEEAGGLGDKLAILLVQLPPSLVFDAAVAEAFFVELKSACPATVVCEPRHPSWFEAAADACLAGCGVGRVAADPARVPEAAVPGGWRGISYFRLHGSPQPYRSSYDDERLSAYAALIRADRGARAVWCMFDNTASSAATGNALSLLEKL